MSCVIREVTINDAAALFALVENFATSFRAEREEFEICLKHLMSDECAWLRVAECGGQVVGYCLGFDHHAFYANGRVSWVEEIMVDAKFRRTGLGTALMNAFEEWARSRGAKLVGLATRRAAPFYTALQYEESAIYFRKLL